MTLLSIDVIRSCRYALAQAITKLESSLTQDQIEINKFISQFSSTLSFSDAINIGITGASGAGKSSFIETFGNCLLDSKANDKLAVLTIDPSSVISGGSLLGYFID